MKITLLTLLTLSSSVLSALTVVPSKINYQGVITSTDGSPMVSTTNTITAYLYGTESGGTALYSESFVNVNSDTNGIYSIEIGDVGLQSVLEGNNELWLELIINQQTLSPRQKINSVPYSLVAKAAESVVPGSDADAAISTNALDISALQTDVDQNEADADLAIAALQAADASSARQIVVDFGLADNVPYLASTYIDLVMPNNSGYYSCAVGDTVLLTGQSNPSENGIYEITSFDYISTNFNKAFLARSLNYDSAEELNEVDLVFIEKGELSGVTFMPGVIAQTFVLGSDAITWHRLGINPNQNIEFGGRVTADELVVNGNYGSVNFDGSNNNISGSLYVSGSLDVSGYRANFDYVDEVIVPTPDQPNEATNKAYVDAAVATNASAINTEATTRTSEITALQTDIDQNESDADAAISNNTDAISILSGRAGVLEGSAPMWTNNANAISLLDGRTSVLEGSAPMWTNNANAISLLDGRTSVLEGSSSMWTDNADAISTLQADVDQNESDADAAIATLQTSDAARPSQVPVLLAHEGNYPTLNNVYVGYWDSALGQSKIAEVGDRILMVGQSSASENGIYEVETLNSSFASLVRADDYNSAEEINAGDFVFVQAGDFAGQGYVLGATSESFQLGVDALDFNRFTIDTTAPVDFEDRITARELRINGWGGSVEFDGSYNYISGNLDVSGNYVSFDSVNEVIVPTPDQPNEATNKAYVDAAVATNASAITTEATTRTSEITALQTDIDQNESDADMAIADNAQRIAVLETAAPMWVTNETAIADSAQRIAVLETAAPMWVTNETAIADSAQRIAVLETAAPMWVTNETAIADSAQRIAVLETAAPMWVTNETAISTLQADVDQNEADADAAIATLQTSDANRPSQVPVLVVYDGHNSNLSSVYFLYYDAAQNQHVTAEIGDRVLMVGQANPAENGIYEVESVNGYYASFVRADDYNSAEEINAGDFVFVQAGSFEGQGYVLGALSETFELGVDALNFSRFTIDTTAPVDFEDRITARELRINGWSGSVEFNGSYNYISGDLNVSGNRVDLDYVNEVIVPTPDQPNEATNKAYVDAAVATNASAINTEATTRTSEITALQTDIDQNESDADVAIAAEAATARAAEQANADAIAAEAATARAAEQTNADAITALQSDVDQNESDADTAITSLQNQLNLNPARGLINYAIEVPVYLGPASSGSGASYSSSNFSNYEIGDKILLTAQSDASENGIYEIVFSELGQGYLNRASDFDSEEELTLGIFVFVESSSTVHGYVLDERAENFVLDDPSNGAFGFSRFTVDTTELVNFPQGISALSIGGHSITVAEANVLGDMAINHNFQAGGDTTLMNTSITNLSVGSDTNLNNLIIHGNTTAMGDVLIDDDLTVNGLTTINSDLTLAGQIITSGASVYGDSFIRNNLHVDQSTTIGGSLTVNYGTSNLVAINTSSMTAADANVLGSMTVNSFLSAHTFEVTGSQISNNFTGNGYINFAGASSVVVPDPTISEEAANKNYVDDLVSTSIASDNAKGLVQLAVTENVSNLNEYYLTYESGGSTLNPAQGDLVLLTGQTTNSENGIYEVVSVNLSSSYSSLPSSSEPSSSSSSGGSSSSSSSGGPAASDYYVILTRASNFDSAEEFVTGSFVFVEKGAQVGQGYVLGELANNFLLGTSPVNYIQFTVDTTSNVAFDQGVSASYLTSSGDLSISGNSSFSGNSTFGNDINVTGRVNSMNGTSEFFGIDVWNIDVANTVDTMNVYVGNLLRVSGDFTFYGTSADFEDASEVRVPTPDQDYEATNKAYVDGVVVPSGGLVAWSSASTIPTGWSDAGLSSPMPNYIWIVKD